jgi:hypothetical protein
LGCSAIGWMDILPIPPQVSYLPKSVQTLDIPGGYVVLSSCNCHHLKTVCLSSMRGCVTIRFLQDGAVNPVPNPCNVGGGLRFSVRVYSLNQ